MDSIFNQDFYSERDMDGYHNHPDHQAMLEEEANGYMPCLDVETDNPAEACQGCMNCPGWK